MTDTPTVEPLTDGDAARFTWEEVRDRMAAMRVAWLATVHPSGRPHVRPVLSVVVGGRVHTTSAPTARKGRNLAVDPRCTLSLRDEGIEVVVEGRAVRVTEAIDLAGISRAYETKYGWITTVDGDALHADGAAPTAGAPPYEPWAVDPATVLVFGPDEDGAPHCTRFRF